METRLSAIEIEAFLSTHPGWQLSRVGVEALQGTWHFADFHQTMDFVNAVAAVAHAQKHHPELHVGYGQCTVCWMTHDVGGLSSRDLAAAAAVDALPEGRLGAAR